MMKIGAIIIGLGILIGGFFVFVDYPIEWAEVNLLTLSTKQKQAKYLEYADRRARELMNNESLEALRNYQANLRRAEDMAEKIIFLDGAELPIAVEFEKRSRGFEQRLVSMPEKSGIVVEAVITTRNENRKVFEYMVTNYQFTDDDIKFYGGIVRDHIASFLTSNRPDVRGLVLDAEDHLNHGLNIRAYEIVEKGKNILYASRMHESH